MTWVDEDSMEWNHIPNYEVETALLQKQPESVMKNFFWKRFAEEENDQFSINVREVRKYCARWNLSKGKKVRTVQNEQLRAALLFQ